MNNWEIALLQMEEGAEVDTDERLERERQALRAEYEEKIQQLHLEIEKEQQTNAKVFLFRSYVVL